ncbi:MAG: AAA family ATPase [Parachlamydia sp.]|nr:AAA family ATPase [Parachlamydia sp.]
MKKCKRNIKDSLLDGLKTDPVVIITGARQAGKTTLIKKISEKDGFSYVTFDDLFSLGAAEAYPIGFVESLSKPAITR